MIVFELDGVLADIEHRRHFVDPSMNKNYEYHYHGFGHPAGNKGDWYHKKRQKSDFIPNWHSYHTACVDDKPKVQTINIFQKYIHACGWSFGPQIWTSRCESQREKTVEWLICKISGWDTYRERDQINSILKMRPVGDDSAAWQIKERWLDQSQGRNIPLSDLELRSPEDPFEDPPKIDFVFESDPESIAMYRKHGIFVFDCNQRE